MKFHGNYHGALSTPVFLQAIFQLTFIFKASYFMVERASKFMPNPLIKLVR